MRVSYIDIIALFSLDNIEIPNPMAHRYYIQPRAFSFFRNSCCAKLYVFHYLSKLHMNGWTCSIQDMYTLKSGGLGSL